MIAIMKRYPHDEFTSSQIVSIMVASSYCVPKRIHPFFSAECVHSFCSDYYPKKHGQVIQNRHNVLRFKVPSGPPFPLYCAVNIHFFCSPHMHLCILEVNVCWRTSLKKAELLLWHKCSLTVCHITFPNFYFIFGLGISPQVIFTNDFKYKVFNGRL